MVDGRARITALLKATFAVAVWGASFIATKVALRELAPILLIWLRFGIGVAILAAAVVARKEFALVSLRELGYFSLLGFLGITFHQGLQANGLVTAQATTTAWIVATTPIFIGLLGWLVLKESLGWSRVGGIAVATVGVLLVVSHGDLGSLMRGQFGTHGDILVLISAPNWAVFSVLSRRGLRQYPATRMMLYVMTTGWLFVSLLTFLDSGSATSLNDLPGLSLSVWLSVAFLGVLCSGVAYIYWYDALKHLPASRVGALLYLEPLVAVAVAAVVLQEAILLAAVLGGALILLGVWLVNRPAS